MTVEGEKTEKTPTASQSRWTRWLPFAVPAAIGFGAAAVFSGAFASFVQYSNTMDFCISCHEMRSTVHEEYKQSTHFSSRSGVHPACADCHVPHDGWLRMVFYKVGATKELFSHVIGAVDTPEKFEARRLALAERVWAEMKGNDSANCRHCHSVAEWDLALHKPRARAQHEDMTRTGETCIDCHKGIAHKAVHEKTEEDDAFTLEEEAEPFELQ